MFHLQVLMPDQPYYDGHVLSVIIPGELGYLGILQNHASLITSVQSGILTITLPDNTKKQYQVGKGFFRFKNNQAILLIDKLQDLADPGLFN